MFIPKGRSYSRPPAPAKAQRFVVDVAHTAFELGEPSVGYSSTQTVWAIGRSDAWNQAATLHRSQFGLAPWLSLTCVGMREDKPVLAF
jgi:hypothetical protein